MKKEFVKKLFPILITLLLSCLFWVTRLINLTIIPIFTDEAIYLRWGQIALSDPRWRFISLIDGKQPLLIWLFLPALKLIYDPLIAGRLVSILAGFGGMLGLCVFTWYLTRSYKGVFISGILYILIPFFLMYDRLAVYEALFTAIAIWIVFLLYLFAIKQRLDTALLLGTAIGIGLLTKSYANYYLILLPATFLLVPWKTKTWRMQLVKWICLSTVVLIQSQIYNNILRLSEFRHVIGQKNLAFIYSPSEFLHNPFQSAWGNLVGLTSWLTSYLTLPFIICILLACVWYIKKNWRSGLFFLSYFLFPFVSLAFFGKVIYPRFLLFMLPPLLIVVILYAVYIWENVSKRTWFIGVCIILVLSFVYFDIKILTDPIHAPLPFADRQQFINDWPAGYGIPEVVKYLDEQSKQGGILVGTEGTFGLYPMALELYLGKNPNITFDAIWPIGGDFPKQLIEGAKTKPTFILFKEKQNIPSEWPLVLIKNYQRGDGPTYLKFYRVVPKT